MVSAARPKTQNLPALQKREVESTEKGKEVNITSPSPALNGLAAVGGL
jgi:hypothetical protein